MDAEGLRRAWFQAEQLLVEPGRIGLALRSRSLTSVCGRTRRRLPRGRDRGRPYRRGRRRGLRLVRNARARSRSRCSAPFTASSSIPTLRAAERDRREIARVERRDGVERRGERERPAFFDVHVAHVGRVHRFDAAFAQRIVHRARDQVVRDVVEDLVLEALLDDARRRLAGTESGDARLACE